MELSGKLEYAMLALLALVDSFERNQPLQISQIAALQNIPRRYLEQILTALRRGGLIKSVRGQHGGYILAQNPARITFLDAVNCMEDIDTSTISQSVTAKTLESELIMEIWQQANRAAMSVLQKYTLQDTCERRDARQPSEPMYYI
jgi:Rrf2 family protein